MQRGVGYSIFAIFGPKPYRGQGIFCGAVRVIFAENRLCLSRRFCRMRSLDFRIGGENSARTRASAGELRGQWGAPSSHACERKHNAAGSGRTKLARVRAQAKSGGPSLARARARARDAPRTPGRARTRTREKKPGSHAYERCMFNKKQWLARVRAILITGKLVASVAHARVRAL